MKCYSAHFGKTKPKPLYEACYIINHIHRIIGIHHAKAACIIGTTTQPDQWHLDYENYGWTHKVKHGEFVFSTSAQFSANESMIIDKLFFGC